jgi:uncharacterized protein YndB with AHSA1/START domain
MTDRKLTHHTFVLERDYKSSPTRVFQAFADPDIKARWFGGTDRDVWKPIERSIDFREGGREVDESEWTKNGMVSRFDAVYHEIVENLRIVYSYEMRVNGDRLSVSISSIEFEPNNGGTHLRLTEQGTYFDNLDNADQREQGTSELLDALGVEVDR